MRAIIREFLAQLRAIPLDEDLGLGLAPGDSQYRAYVGPPEDYDLIAATTFNLLTNLGLRQHHKVLDIGCGSLRIGRLLIPYLNVGGYTGIDPNGWLIDEGMRRETGHELIAIKRARLIVGASTAEIPIDHPFDFAVAQSIFSHAGPDIVAGWLLGAALRLRENGVLAATFIASSEGEPRKGWTYPACVSYREDSMARMASNAGLEFQPLDWPHPRQSWALFKKPRI